MTDFMGRRFQQSSQILQNILVYIQMFQPFPLGIPRVAHMQRAWIYTLLFLSSLPSLLPGHHLSRARRATATYKN